jgi:hypothetical protein
VLEPDALHVCSSRRSADTAARLIILPQDIGIPPAAGKSGAPKTAVVPPRVR